MNKKKYFTDFITIIISMVMFVNFDYIFYIYMFILMLVLYARRKENKKTNLLFILVVLLLMKILEMYSNVSLVNVLIITSFLLLINYIITLTIIKKEDSEFKKEKMSIAKKEVINQTNVIILITKENQLIWANGYAYDEFPSLLKEQNINFIKEKIKNNILEINNKIFSVELLDEVYYLTNITKEEREIRKLKDLQLIIGIIQIDNHSYLQQVMDKSDFLEMDTKIKLKLIDWFKESNIYYQEIEDDKFQLNIPNSILIQHMNDRFPQINEIVSSVKESGFDVSLSMGIAYNYENNLEIGQMAVEALELANSRGGSQIVVFNNGKRTYFGGRISDSKNNSTIRSRFIYNSILNNANESDTIYIMGHQNLDYDALSSIALIANLFEEKEVKVLIDKNSKKKLIDKAYNVIPNEMIYKDTVVDKTKKNLLIVVDTQSKTIISHPNIYNEISECIVIDHHQTPENYMDVTLFSWIEPTASSTTELILSMYMSANRLISNQSIAKLAMLGVITDTNNLKYRITSNTISVLGYLFTQNTSVLNAQEELQLSNKDYILKEKILSSRKIENHVAIIESDEFIEDDLHSIIANEIVEIKEVFVSIVILKDQKDLYKIKMRSDGTVNCKTFLEEFGGGGHIRQGAGIFGLSTVVKVKDKIKKLEFKERD